MTMSRAVGLLFLSIAVMALGIFLIIRKVDGGIIDASIAPREPAARIGENPATPEGATGITLGQANATFTAASRQLTAISATLQPGVTVAAGRTPTPGAVVGSIGDTVAVGSSRYTVHQVADPEPPGLFRTETGMRRVALEVSQEALAAGIASTFALFKIRVSTGEEYTWAITNSEPNFGSGTLAAGEIRRGWMSFQVPAAAVLESLILQIPGRGDAEIAKLR